MRHVDRDVWLSDGTGRFESSTFRADLAWSAGALRRAPLLLVVTLLLALALAAVGGSRSILGLPFEIVIAGFVGTQRLWFARLFRGDELHGRDIWSTTWSFIGRFIALGLVVTIVSIPVLLLLTVVMLHDGAPIGAVIAVHVVYGLVLDVALTFVVPALALTPASVRMAFVDGFRMLRQTWPRCAWYIFTPGFTLVALAQAFRPHSSTLPTTLVIGAVTSALALWFKGAIVAFYLRQNPVSE